MGDGYAMEEGDAGMVIKFTGKVGPINRNSDYANPFVVYADTRDWAISKAISLSGFRERDARVWISAFEEQPPQQLLEVSE